MLQIDESAVGRIKEFLSKNPDAAGKPFRVALKPGGCSGYMYDFSFDAKTEADQAVEKDGLTFILDPNSAVLLKNSTLKFVADGFMGGSFQCISPDAAEACGCGKSVGFAAPQFGAADPFAAALAPKPTDCKTSS